MTEFLLSPDPGKGPFVLAAKAERVLDEVRSVIDTTRNIALATVTPRVILT